MKFVRLLMLWGVCVLPLVASAQWQWVDKDGKKVFSDQAPPTDVPEKNIVRRPGSPSTRPTFAPAPAEPAAAGSEPARPPASAASAARPSGVDKELEEKTRKAEEAEKAKQAAEAQKVAKAKADNCNRARQGKATFDSGMRVARLNAQGEREVMDDKVRAAEQQRLQSIIDSDCK
ncbi:DUF4124 domain-containing protein [Variovorax sp. LT2P21]|uniref:DUF4124 domain-containing protein n=1 Tax=Variovorax sp. LT2P21 TaxID=3443731 RepID=UPI003F478464